MRRLEGPKDLPAAVTGMLFNARDLARARAASEYPDRIAEFVQDTDFTGSMPSMVWVTKEMGLQAAEAAADYKVRRAELQQLHDTMRDLGGDSVVEGSEYFATVLAFPEGVIPDTFRNGKRYKTRGIYLSILPAHVSDEDGAQGVTIGFTPLVSGETVPLAGVASIGPVFTSMDFENEGRWDYISVDIYGVEIGEVDRYYRKLLRGSPDPDKIGRFTMAVMSLMMEPGIAKTTMVRAGRKDAVYNPVKGEYVVPEIRRVELREMRYVRATHDSSGRKYTHRWVVRGHWRNQWFPGTKSHRQTYIAPYLKGPEGAPLLTSPKVYVWSR